MALSRERLDGEARRRRISFMDLRGATKPASLSRLNRRRRFFCRRALSLVGHRSLGICSLLASRPAAKSLAAPYAIIYDVVFSFVAGSSMMNVIREGGGGTRPALLDPDQPAELFAHAGFGFL